MINRLLFLLVLGGLMVACNTSEKQKEAKAIFKLEKILKAERDVNKEEDSARDLIEKSVQFAAKYPEDTLTASMLFKAADVARGIGEHEKAIELWGRVNTEYESHKNAPEALFLQGFTFDQGLNNKQKAKEYFKRFLKKYPDHDLVKDIKLMMSQYNQEKSDLDLIKEFKKKSQGELE